MTPTFDAVTTLWTRALAGDGAALGELADFLDVPGENVRSARDLARAALPLTDLCAVVATVRAYDPAPSLPERETARLIHLHATLARCEATLPGFGAAMVRARPYLLRQRPTLDTLRGRARVLEEVRRDLVRQPSLPMPENLEELLAEAGAAQAASPPLPFLETSRDDTPSVPRRREEGPMITAGQLMTRDVLSVSEELSVAELAEFFDQHRVSGAPVISPSGTAVGVVSLTDVTRSSAVRSSLAEGPHDVYVRGLERHVDRSELTGYRVFEEPDVKVKDIMTPVVFSVDESTRVQDVAQSMLTGRIHRVFVTRDGKIVGIISTMDLLPLVRDMP